MYDSADAEAYVERAEMHEHLASTTEDVPARKMHQAMAEAYRRKAEEANSQMITAIPLEMAPNKVLVSSGF